MLAGRMPLTLIQDGIFKNPAVPMKRVVLGAGFVVLFLVAGAFHVLAWQTGIMPGATLTFIYNVLVLGSFTLLWFFLNDLVDSRRTHPARTYGLALLAGVLFLTVARFASPESSTFGLSDDSDIDILGFDYVTGLPVTLATVLRINFLTLFEAIYAFLLLIWLRELVLYKRTRTSQRNWYVMLALMVGAALTAFMYPPRSEPGVLQNVAMIPAMGLMVVNAFRVSWIVSLSVREKGITIGLSLLLLVMLVAGIAIGEDSLLPGAYTYMRHYSFPLTQFVRMAIFFGILYCTTSLLSMVFHLPTTGEFRRVDALRAKAGEMVSMNAVPRFVSQVFERDKLFESITASAIEAGAAHGAWLALPDLSTGSLRPRIRALQRLDPTRVESEIDVHALYEDLQERRKPILLDHARADRRVSVRSGSEIGSLLVLPLIAREEIFGALFCTREVTYGFEQDDVEALQVYAAQAAMAIDNSRLFEEQIEKERLTRELDIARAVQQRLLPQQLPVISGLGLAASSVSATEVGGDYYDFLPLPDGRMAIIVADVSGKGTSAAFYMAAMQGIFRSLARLTTSPADFMAHANEVLVGALEKQAFVSAVYAVLDPEKEILEVARGGHCPVAMINLDGTARMIRTNGMGLGLTRGEMFKRSLEVETIALMPGDAFVFYTDGVVESRDPEGEEYGYDRLLDALRAHRHEDAADIHRNIVDELNRFVRSENYGDDMTMLVLKWHGLSEVAETPRASEFAHHT
jgi:phosphoserine phosphatase RsbU/P